MRTQATISLRQPQTPASPGRFTAMGMCLETDFPFCVLPRTEAATPADICIVQGSCFPAATAGARRFGKESRAPGTIWGFEDGNGFQATVAAVGRYRIHAGGRLANYELDPACSFGDAQHWFCGFLLGVIALTRRRTVLHASGMVAGGAGVAFIGPGGTGKTTLAAFFGRAGHPLLSEDALPVEVVDGELRASPYLPGMRLWPESIDHLAGDHTCYSPVLSWMDKRRVPIGGEWGKALGHPVPLRMIYDLAPLAEPGGDIDVTAVSGAAAVMRLQASIYFADALSCEQQFAVLADVEGIARMVPMRRLTYPRGFATLPALRAAILADVERLAQGVS